MEIRTREKLNPVLSILTLLFFSPGLLGELQMPDTNVIVIEGKTAVLRASYTGGDLSTATIIWNYLANEPKMIISYINGNVNQGQDNHRVGFVHQISSKNLTIYINNTVESDSGRYMCQVVLPGTSGSPKEMTLNVTVPPAVPVCKMDGSPEVKANVTLTCLSSSGKPVPIYKWSKTSPNSAFFFSPMLNEVTGTLKLTHLTSNMSGKYECTASNSAGIAKCYIDLEVINSTKAGMIAGIVLGSIAGLVLITLFIMFLWTRRKKDLEEDLANDIKEDAQAPKRASWAKSGAGSDIISKNGTLSSVRSSPLPQDTHDHHHHHYPITQPTSDTASIITASTSYRPRPAGISSSPVHTPPGYSTDAMVLRNVPVTPSFNADTLPRTEPLQPPTSRYVPAPSGMSAANLTRMGGVPIMVPAQNQAGSLV